MLAVPIVVLAVNFFPTMASAARALRRDWSYRFVSVGAFSLVLGFGDGSPCFLSEGL